MPSKLVGEIEDAFRTSSLRLTSQRYAVLEFLVRSEVHATADEIFHAVNRHDPRASRATVYNNLRALTRAGLVREVAGEGTAARFDANLHRHHHFICEDCGAVEDVPWFDLPESLALPPLGGGVVRNFEITLRGACGRCRRRASA